MYTRCPECQATYKVKADQLRKTRGIFRCKRCGAQFDALQLISEKVPKRKASAPYIPQSQPLWEASKAASLRTFWSAGLIAALIVLSAQFFYFEYLNLVQSTVLRPSLERLCAALSCQLPLYRNVGELDILKSTFQLEANQNYRLQAAIVNRSRFAQAYPRLKLNLTDFKGDSYAARIFSPQEYLPQDPQASLAAGAIAEIGIDIAAPAVPIGGFSIELL